MWPLAEISTRGPSVVRWEALLDYDETLAMAERVSKTYSRVMQTSEHTADHRSVVRFKFITWNSCPIPVRVYEAWLWKANPKEASARMTRA